MRHPENECGDSEAEFGHKKLFLNCCDLILFLFMLDLCMCVYLFTGEPDDSDDCVVPTRECRWICNEENLQLSPSSGCCPEYLALRDHGIAIIHRHVFL